MNDYKDLMTVLDENDEVTLYKLENDLFDTVVVIYNEDEVNEEAWVLTDMQGQYPKTIEEMCDFEWCRAEDVDW